MLRIIRVTPLRSIALCPLLRRSPPPRPPPSPTRLVEPTSSPHPADPTRGRRWLSAGPDHSKEVDEINLKFAEARDDIEAALESRETIYFDEEAEVARGSARAVLDRFDGLLGRVSEEERGALLRSMGMKMQQLKAELEQLDH